MALLVAISGAIGVVSYASMDVVLSNQLNEQLMHGLPRPAAGRQPVRPS